MDYRQELLMIAADLDITDEEAGEEEWAYYLSDDQLAEAIHRLRPEAVLPEKDSDE